MASIAFYSGGLDSTAMLYLLSQTDEEIIAHHVYFETDTERDKLEMQAVEKIQKYFGDRFKWESSSISLMGAPLLKQSRDVIWFSIIGAVYTAYENVDNIYFGFEHQAADVYYKQWLQTAEDLCNGVLEKALPLSCKGDLVNEDPDKIKPYKIISPVAGLSKADEYNLLPEELKKVVWSCRNPQRLKSGVITHCGTCEPCSEYTRHNLPFNSTRLS
ncbi:hypothetical protein [Vibrio sp. ER1A]|uniref:hypothetical protein n=1 Tax=Vibrio sp. ER1A TaxID=1517681 RepID=UPI0004DD7D6C|nr:hypothetical protein [Vibrio sp. ER1A]KFA97561.1 hypothetical protein HW45_09135 [Vibrio sp. ER1A]